jgi:hypothetical protein
MFRNTKEPSSGSEHLCLAKVTCGSMVQVHVNSVSIVVAYKYVSCNGKSVCCVCVFTFNSVENYEDLKSYIPYPTAFPYGNGMVLHFYQ